MVTAIGKPPDFSPYTRLAALRPQEEQESARAEKIARVIKIALLIAFFVEAVLFVMVPPWHLAITMPLFLTLALIAGRYASKAAEIRERHKTLALDEELYGQSLRSWEGQVFDAGLSPRFRTAAHLGKDPTLSHKLLLRMHPELRPLENPDGTLRRTIQGLGLDLPPAVERARTVAALRGRREWWNPVGFLEKRREGMKAEALQRETLKKYAVSQRNLQDQSYYHFCGEDRFKKVSEALWSASKVTGNERVMLSLDARVPQESFEKQRPLFSISKLFLYRRLPPPTADWGEWIMGALDYAVWMSDHLGEREKWAGRISSLRLCGREDGEAILDMVQELQNGCLERENERLMGYAYWLESQLSEAGVEALGLVGVDTLSPEGLYPELLAGVARLKELYKRRDRAPPADPALPANAAPLQHCDTFIDRRTKHLLNVKERLMAPARRVNWVATAILMAIFASIAVLGVLAASFALPAVWGLPALVLAFASLGVLAEKTIAWGIDRVAANTKKKQVLAMAAHLILHPTPRCGEATIRLVNRENAQWNRELEALERPTRRIDVLDLGGTEFRRADWTMSEGKLLIDEMDPEGGKRLEKWKSEALAKFAMDPDGEKRRVAVQRWREREILRRRRMDALDLAGTEFRRDWAMSQRKLLMDQMDPEGKRRRVALQKWKSEALAKFARV